MVRWPVVLVLWISLLFLGCDKTYSQGDCEPGYLKVDGRCVLAVGEACTSNGNCLSNICLTSDAGSRFCSIACRLHEDCPIGFFCTTWDDRRCYPGQRPPPCTTDAECAACEHCEEGACAPTSGCRTCAEDAECLACERCDQAACISVAGCTTCQVDADCPTCERCGELGSCSRVSGCLLCASDPDCPGCTDCERGACMPITGCGIDPCFNDSQCPQRTRCLTDAATGLNVCLPADLTFGEDCSRGGDQTCAGGVCLTSSDGLTASCSRACEADADCPQAYLCSPDEQCLWACRLPQSAPPGQQCAADRDCPPGRICGLVVDAEEASWQARCVDPLPCATDNGQICDPNAAQARCRTDICTDLGFCSPVCAADLDCPLDFLCGWLDHALPTSGSQAPFLGCSPADATLAELGEPCPSGDGDCRSGHCLSGGAFGPRPICTQACDPALANCPDRFSCQLLDSGLEEDGTWCRPALLQGSCGNDGQCAQDHVCQFSASTGLSSCGSPPADGEPAGAPCLAHTDCNHGLCLRSGTCAAPCEQAADCPSGLWCDLTEWIRDDGGRLWLRACTAEPGSLLPCRNTSTCPSGEVCRPELNPWAGGLDGRCGLAIGTGSIFSACLGTAECGSGVCLPLGYCSALCQMDADCPEGSRCTLFDLPAWQDASLPTAACLAPLASLGEPCPGGADDCESAICHAPSDGEAYCSANCVTDDDCTKAPDMLCLDEGQGGQCLFGTP